MSTALTERLAKLRAGVPAGCAACWSGPKVRFLREGDLEPPTRCAACGRVCRELTQVIGVI